MGQHWSDLPIEVPCPLCSVLAVGISVVGIIEDPNLNGTWPMQTLPGLALGEGRTRRKELLGSNFVVTGLERPVRQKGHLEC